MKMNLGKRILMFFHALFSLLICAAFAAYLIVPDFLMKIHARAEAALGARRLGIIGIALLVVYAALAIALICLVFRHGRREERGYISVDSSDAGKVRIAVSAIEQMVRQSVLSIDGITDMKIDITNEDDAIAIGVNASILNGSHVPTITMNMQRSIRQFVEVNCGVAVRSVSISINSVSDLQEAPRRRRLGRARAAVTPEKVPVQRTDTDLTEEVQDAPVASAPETESAIADDDPAGANAQTAAEDPEPAAFDFDRPYESEFAKDLAAMKAREAAATGDISDAREENGSGDDKA